MDKTRVKANEKDGVTTVRILITHNMDVEGVDKKTDQKIEAHFIQEITCSHNNEVVMTANWTQGISKNPYLSFKFRGAKRGDTLKVYWVDNKGESETTETPITE